MTNPSGRSSYDQNGREQIIENASETLNFPASQKTQATPKPQQNPNTAKTMFLNRHQAQTVFRKREGLTAALENMLSVPRQDTASIQMEHILLAALLGIILVLRITNLNFNTLHLDEAIYTTVGEEARAGVFNQGATAWMYGSYLYPVTASLANDIGGVAGIRLVSALLSVVTAFFVYLTTARVFNRPSALFALLIFGLTGISINVGQLATYDALGLPLFAIAMFCSVSAITKPESAKKYLLWAGITFSLSVLAKYISLLLLPTLVIIMLVLHLYQRRSLISFFTQIPWMQALIPMVIILGIYGAYYREDLVNISGQDYAFQPEPRLEIIGQIVQQIGLHLLLAAASMLLIARKILKTLAKPHPAIAILLLLSLPVLLTVILAMPVYHIAASNARSMWKHNVYTLALLSPLIGYGVAELVEIIRSRQGNAARGLRLVGAALTIILLLWFVISSARQNSDFQASWPDNTPVIDFMRAHGINENSRILSSGYAIYDYYFDLGVYDRPVWSNIWYTEYGDLKGEEAVRQGIQDCIFDMIVLDNYWAPEYGGELMNFVQSAGYVQQYSVSEQISAGDTIITNIYFPPLENRCVRGEA